MADQNPQETMPQDAGVTIHVPHQMAHTAAVWVDKPAEAAPASTPAPSSANPPQPAKG